MGIFGLGACATPRNHPALCHRIIVKSCNARSDCCACRVSNGIKILRQEEANIMRKLLLFSLLLTISAGAVAQTAASPSAATSAISISSNGPVVADYGKQPQSSDPVENNIAKEVRHKLLMLPYYSLFDDLEYNVQGRTVTLSGSLTSEHGVTKADAENAVKRIEGVDKVINDITILPASPMDERARIKVYRSLENTGSLSRY